MHDVWLVGAGPGDPDLLTRKAERLIREASVIFYDALVGPGVLALIPAHVRCIPVGKRSGHHSKDQRTINDLLVEAARAGEHVVRLKGGDPRDLRTIRGRSCGPGRARDHRTHLSRHHRCECRRPPMPASHCRCADQPDASSS